ncbi:MAG: BatA and WFA domain-containing protein [Elusimicrobia bacterium]|jgi:hypothetical protein|nr:BatA and WFA domain-containing protein [Elusimicrobiota bacterium]
MTFLNPIFLFFLPLGAIPVLLHLLNKDKIKKKEFSTLRFLTPATRKTLKRFKFLEILLLVVRIFIILLITLGFSRPVWKGHIKDQKKTVSRIILIDNSYTMGYKKGEGDIFESTKELAIKTVNNTKGAVAVGTINKGLKKLTLFTADKSEIIQAINSIELSEEVADIPVALKELGSRLRLLNYGGHYKVLLFSDFKKSNSEKRVLFERAERAERAENFSRKSERSGMPVSPPPAVFLIDTNDGVYNKAVAGVDQKSYFTGAESVIRADIYSYSPSYSPSPAGVSLIIDGVKRNTRQITLDGRGPVTFKYQFNRPGTYRGEIKLNAPIKSDRISLDNSYYFNAEVYPRLNVLLADGEPGYTLTGGESYFISKVLGSGNLQIPLKFRVIDSSQLSLVSLKEYDLVFLVNVAGKDIDNKSLLSYSAAGGGVGIFSGDNINAGDYNRLLKALIGIEISHDGVVEFNDAANIKAGNEFKDVFFKRDRSKRKSVNVKKYIKVEDEYSGSASLFFGDIPVLWLSSGNGYRGRGAFFSLTASREWSDFPLKGDYPVFIDTLIRYLYLPGNLSGNLSGKESKENRGYRIGDTLPVVDDPGKLTVNGDNLSEKLLNKYPVAVSAGNYSFYDNILSEKSLSENNFSSEKKIIPVNLNTDSGDYRLEEIGVNGLKKLFRGYNYVYLPYSKDLYGDIIRTTSGRQKSVSFFAAAFILLLFEEIIRKKFLPKKQTNA